MVDAAIQLENAHHIPVNKIPHARQLPAIATSSRSRWRLQHLTRPHIRYLRLRSRLLFLRAFLRTYSPPHHWNSGPTDQSPICLSSTLPSESDHPLLNH
jgi:hypothetical protein